MLEDIFVFHIGICDVKNRNKFHAVYMRCTKQGSGKIGIFFCKHENRSTRNVLRFFLNISHCEEDLSRIVF